MKKFIFSTLLFFAFGACLSVISGEINAAAGETLDGKSYSINYTEYGKSDNPTKDVLIFKDGKFQSTDCEQYGFGPAIYESASKNGATLFESTITSEKEGKVEWEGKIDGDSITGNFMWSKPGQEPIMYTYSGSIMN